MCATAGEGVTRPETYGEVAHPSGVLQQPLKADSPAGCLVHATGPVIGRAGQAGVAASPLLVHLHRIQFCIHMQYKRRLSLNSAQTIQYFRTWSVKLEVYM